MGEKYQFEWSKSKIREKKKRWICLSISKSKSSNRWIARKVNPIVFFFFLIDIFGQPTGYQVFGLEWDRGRGLNLKISHAQSNYQHWTPLHCSTLFKKSKPTRGLGVWDALLNGPRAFPSDAWNAWHHIHIYIHACIYHYMYALHCNYSWQASSFFASLIFYSLSLSSIFLLLFSILSLSLRV